MCIYLKLTCLIKVENLVNFFISSNEVTFKMVYDYFSNRCNVLWCLKRLNRIVLTKCVGEFVICIK